MTKYEIILGSGFSFSSLSKDVSIDTLLDNGDRKFIKEEITAINENSINAIPLPTTDDTDEFTIHLMTRTIFTITFVQRLIAYFDEKEDLGIEKPTWTVEFNKTKEENRYVFSISLEILNRLKITSVIYLNHVQPDSIDDHQLEELVNEVMLHLVPGYLKDQENIDISVEKYRVTVN